MLISEQEPVYVEAPIQVEILRLSESSLLVTWVHGSGNTHRVNCWMEDSPLVSWTLEAKSTLNVAIIRDLDPGQTYRISVTSLSGLQESKEEPFGGCQIKTGKIPTIML